MYSGSISTRRIVRIGLIAAAYTVLTVAFEPISYGFIQVRLSEILMLLCFFKADYCVALTLGCAAANMFSPFALLDVPFGTLATALAALLMYRSKRFALSSLYPVLTNGLIVGGVVAYSGNLPYLTTALWIAAGEMLAVTAVGVAVMKLLMKNTAFRSLIISNENGKKIN